MAEGDGAAGLPPPRKPSLAHRVTTICFVLMFVAACVMLPVIIWEMWIHHFELHRIAWVVAGAFTAMTVPVTLYEVTNHLNNYRQPKLQRYVIRILWMPTIYAIDSFLSLRYKEASLYWQAVRDVYEAWTIYAFYGFLSSYLEGDGARGSLTVNPIVTTAEDHKHMIPFCCFKPWTMANGAFIRKTHWGVAQYSLIMVGCAIATFATQYSGTYHDGTTKPTVAWPYIAFTINLSQVIALYCLVLLYHSFSDALKPIHPFFKFVVIKAVVFFTFWQDMLLTALVHEGVIKQQKSWSSYNPESSYTVEEVKDGLQNFIVCIEMFLAALAHAYAFPIYDYKEKPNQQPLTFSEQLWQVFGVGDVLHDLLFFFGCMKKEFTPEDIDPTVYNRIMAEKAALEYEDDGQGHEQEMRVVDRYPVGAPASSMAGSGGYPGSEPYDDGRPRSATRGPDQRSPTPNSVPPQPPPGEHHTPNVITEAVDIVKSFGRAVFGGGEEEASKPAANVAPRQH